MELPSTAQQVKHRQLSHRKNSKSSRLLRKLSARRFKFFLELAITKLLIPSSKPSVHKMRALTDFLSLLLITTSLLKLESKLTSAQLLRQPISSIDCSPAVDTRAAQMTSASLALALMSSTDTSSLKITVSDMSAPYLSTPLHLLDI